MHTHTHTVTSAVHKDESWLVAGCAICDGSLLHAIQALWMLESLATCRTPFPQLQAASGVRLCGDHNQKSVNCRGEEIAESAEEQDARVQ